MQFKQVGSLSRSNNAAQGGFTLIELIVVIVILGILAATALPRFADLGQDARFAKLKGARGAVASAASIAHGAWLANGSTGNLTLEGTPVVMTTAGYPDAATIAAAAGLATNDFTVTAGATTVTIGTDTAHTTCVFTYTPTTGAVSNGPVDKTSC